METINQTPPTPEDKKGSIVEQKQREAMNNVRNSVKSLVAEGMTTEEAVKKTFDNVRGKEYYTEKVSGLMSAYLEKAIKARTEQEELNCIWDEMERINPRTMKSIFGERFDYKNNKDNLYRV